MHNTHSETCVYTREDEQVWELLYKRQVETIEDISYAAFKKGLEALDFAGDSIPCFDAINERLQQLTGWSIYPVAGLIDNRYFFEQMMDRRFGSTRWIRKLSQLDYLEEPDMFHDVFGHIPLLTDPVIVEFLEGLARVAWRNLGDEIVIEAVARLYWYTIEFGLVIENGECKIYGAGILSSIGESAYCLTDQANRTPFDLETILNTPYIKDRFQEQYFVLSSMEQLKGVMVDFEGKFGNSN
jgi:phenylalanine-4-hydroxylase